MRSDFYVLYIMTIVEALMVLFYADGTCGHNHGGSGIQSQYVSKSGNLRHVPGQRRIANQESRIGRSGLSLSEGSIVLPEKQKKAKNLTEVPVSGRSLKKPAGRLLVVDTTSTTRKHSTCPDHTRHDVMCRNGTLSLVAGRPSCPVRQVTSPDYPDAYPANRHCNLTIHTPGFALRLWFSYFQLEDGHDWLTITEDGQGSTLRTKTHSGSDIPPPFSATSGHVTLLFHSDEDVEEGGFVVHYESLPVPLVLTKTPPVTGVVDAACPSEVVLVRQASGSITSPRYPHTYPDNLKCRWRIEAPNEQALVRLRIAQPDFHTEAQHDTLLITTDKERIPLSGQLDSHRTIVAASDVRLDFSSNAQHSFTGFRIDYDIIPQNTSTVVVKGWSGVLQSPGYPVDYPVNTRLTWIVHGSPAGSLLRLIDLQLESHQSSDHLLIAQGENLDSGIVTTLYGKNEDLTASSNVIALPNASTFILHFSSRWHSQAKRGWLLTFQPLKPADGLLPFVHRHNKNLQYETAVEEPLDSSLLDSSSQPMLSSGHRSLSNTGQGMAPGSSNRLSHPAGYVLPSSPSSSFSLRGVGTFSTVPLMEIDVQPFYPQQDWQGDLKECLGSLLPRSILRTQRKPVLTTTVLEWRQDDVVRVMITTGEGPEDLVGQLKAALSSGGRVRCNDSLEMYLPDLLRDVHSSISGQNWLLVSVCIIAFFLIIFSAVLFVHCKQRRVIVRKLRSSITSSEVAHQIDSSTPNKAVPSSLSGTITQTINNSIRCQQVLNVAMEPSTQRNPLFFDLGQRCDNTLQYNVDATIQTRKCSKTSSATRSSNVVFRQAKDLNESMDLMDVLRMYPQKLSRAKSAMGGSGINQEIPSLTQGYTGDEIGRKVSLDPALLMEQDETESTRSVGSPYSFDCQMEAEMGETVEVCREVMPESEESLTVSDAINQLNEWRNGRPMTVRAVKHKNLLKKQIKQEIFEDLHCQQTPEDKGIFA